MQESCQGIFAHKDVIYSHKEDCGCPKTLNFVQHKRDSQVGLSHLQLLAQKVVDKQIEMKE